ncbi:NAD-dependent succinate-semialdehyde dehydrogenase [Gilvimarinus algae]|uniref:NAD-dependent succinate-semialdehyde dehydrogenase n=1 Tax=Gilvimarinus algae TaxID=3058037 RepID=A0ABT8TAL8_9GAMM|nr:NAD-dependent succinate-semialdehyde dehydrogenase [Gilvimarinus sp. SDUM040014]MDO3380991.1 NAD-dependent succinate-semialdehyde dehydrogenase [Gilvimarinus sp. SDUM040014]
MLQATNPFTGQKIADYPALNDTQMVDRIGECHSAFASWRDRTFAERAAVLKAVAGKLREQKTAIAKLMADEMGKPIKEGGPEVEKAALCAEFYADNAETFLQSETLASDAGHSYVRYQPLGTLLGILPWNAPLWLAFRYLAPALMAGNTCVMKHDPNVPASAQAIADAFAAAGAPEHIMVNLPVATPQVEGAIRDPRIAAVSFTGSAVAGAKVAAVAGSEIKPSVLELGGSDPCIVLADADLEKAADIAVLSRIINAGQSCIAAKRILVEKPIYGEFVAMLKERLARLQLGDPNLPETDVGPIARDDLRENLHRQVSETIAAGARCLLGGELPAGEGFFYPATLLVDVGEQMTAFREETFGPVMAVTPVADIDEALKLANQTPYGLGAAIWTADTDSAEQWAGTIEAGQVAINGIVKTDPRLPSGGVKRSGYGRELGPHGIKEFVNAKQVWVK